MGLLTLGAFLLNLFIVWLMVWLMPASWGPGAPRIRCDDAWAWVSAGTGIVVGLLVCASFRWGVLVLFAVHRRFDKERPNLSRGLDQALRAVFTIVGIGCLFSYVFFLRSFFSIPPPINYAGTYLIAAWVAVVAGYILFLREFG